MNITELDLKDLKKIRNYFGEHDVTMFEHFAYKRLDDLLVKLTERNSCH